MSGFRRKTSLERGIFTTVVNWPTHCELPLSRLLAQYLVNWDVASKAEVSEFLYPKLTLLADSFLMPNMEGAP